MLKISPMPALASPEFEWTATCHETDALAIFAAWKLPSSDAYSDICTHRCKLIEEENSKKNYHSWCVYITYRQFHVIRFSSDDTSNFCLRQMSSSRWVKLSSYPFLYNLISRSFRKLRDELKIELKSQLCLHFDWQSRFPYYFHISDWRKPSHNSGSRATCHRDFLRFHWIHWISRK